MSSADQSSLFEPLPVAKFADTDQSYKVFVQLLDSEQRIVAQSDKIPFHHDQPRPTTSWVPAEYILDTHHLQLPADLDPTAEYSLIVGLYNEATGERLPAAQTDTDFIPLNPSLEDDR